MRDRILIVEDSRVFAKMFGRLLTQKLGAEVVVARTHAEAQDLSESGEFAAALVDLNLPDAPLGAAVDLLSGKGFPVVVVTAELSAALQRLMWDKQVADYFVKDESLDPEHVVNQIARFRRNTQVQALVVDDSLAQRKYTSSLLRRHRYPVLEASLPSQALRLLDERPDIDLVIVDYNMPEMDGCRVTRSIRLHRPREDCVVVGVSTQGSAEVSARFIKSGANDFIHKPFSPDEFYCRISLNVSMLESFRTIRESSRRDYLTGLYNRRYFYQVAERAHATALQQHAALSVAMLDLDHFKSINDTYGHEAGDAVLRAVSSLLARSSGPQEVPCRLGGEEFCLLLPGVSRDELGRRLEDLRMKLAAEPVTVGPHVLYATASLGGTSHLDRSLDAMLRAADRCVYEAKGSGRNRVVLADSTQDAVVLGC